jgi:phospholipid-translocating ATPase
MIYYCSLTLRFLKPSGETIFLQLIVAVGMGPVLALRYFRNMFRPNAINILQQIEQSNGHTHTTRNMESRIISAGSYLTHLLADSRRNRGATYQPLLSDSVASDG